MKRIASLYIILCTLLVSCMENQGVRAARGKAPGSQLKSGAGNGSGASAIPSSDRPSILDGVLETGRAEVRHIVDPFDGSFKKKITIPKNFTGYLYLSGLNITSLRDRIIKVRFNFGREMESIVIPATVGRANGLTPQTDIEVLIMDVNDRPFENIRLLYDLFDYNDYRDKDANSPSYGDEIFEPTNDPRDSGLYCRGLKLEHDPTFVGSASNTACDETGERCLYAYAKIADSGLYQPSDPLNPASTQVAIVPTQPQIDLDGNGFALNSTTNRLSKCLPDNFNKGELDEMLDPSPSLTSLGYGTTMTIGGKSYTYNGPFRTISSNLWEVKTKTDGVTSAAFFPPPLTSSSLFDSYPSGIFQYSGHTGNPTNIEAGYGSFLFPRRGKIELQSNIEYYGSDDIWGDIVGTETRTSLHELVASGETRSMYGCNIRATNYDRFSNEGIGSCNVTATIEIVALENGVEVVAATAIDVKLQLIRPSLLNFEGEEVLYTAMKTCSTSRACGSNECCFNERCWDRSLVSQCLEDAPIIGNLQVGEPCGTDYECSSLCCNASTGACADHLIRSDQVVLCSKSPGQACVAKEWCRKENISDCFVVKTGTSPTGAVECALRCYNVPTHGDCRSGVCVPPTIPTVPIFDPTNPDCSAAREPPTGF